VDCKIVSPDTCYQEYSSSNFRRDCAMFASYRTHVRYRPIDEAENTSSDADQQPPQSAFAQLRYHLGFVSAAAICLLASGFIVGRLFNKLSLSPMSHGGQAIRCTGPQVRHEWRSLSTEEKHDYIRAVRCLHSTPSRIRPNGTLYDDYPYAHARHGKHCGQQSPLAGDSRVCLTFVLAHNAAPFLPWHRYFLHVYETDLQQTCGYAGSLP